jgi:hypothetical protein
MCASDAIESHIARLMSRIGPWPAFFAGVTAAQRWIGSVVDLRDVYFEGVEEGRFRGYVTYNTARRAWEGGSFKIRDVPGGWVRRSKEKSKSSHPASVATAR